MREKASCHALLAGRDEMPFEQLKRREFIALLGGRVVAHRETALAALFPSDGDSSPSALRRWRDARSACRRAGASPWGQSEMFLIEVLLDLPCSDWRIDQCGAPVPRADVRVGLN